ncbi:glycosyl hydrolase family 28-related protein [Sphingomonas sp.]|uniref:glycosyl hydrolase family 28-related protein n=1 Tax=Sphingomonas sp. TaxID=28214 RepID=UPI0025EBE480|nr:glycosyl hydrolase family 28-related protein [Sphingomonas sp.]MBV9527445.1 right-handed parallel beta-helix repeat-containing protein [Sphingomonas sp.]
MPFPACLAAAALAASTPTAATIAAVPIEQLHGRGAVVPFTEYEAENGCSNGILLGPSRALYSIAAEASGRRAVRLDRPGQFVEFTLRRSANAVTVRYAVPDSVHGSGLSGTLGLYAAGERLGSLGVTSRYGWYYGAYPFTNHPSDGRGHHMFDEARLRFAKVLPAGTRVRIAVGPEDSLPWYVVDLADFELVPPPLARPAASLDVVSFGADPSGQRESSSAFAKAIAAARIRHRPVWIGPGTYHVDRHLMVDRVAINGAGPWYSILSGDGVGLYGSAHASAVHLAHFAIIGDVRERNDRTKLAAVGGTLGGGSTIDDLWLQHHKSGVWLDGPLDRVTIRNMRILDNTADGINLRRGVRDARIENVFVRNSGDDGIALWSHYAADSGDVIAHSTVVAPMLANGIAVYGGRDIRLTANVVADTLTQGGGIHLGNRFRAVPFSDAISINDNLLVRSGSFDPNWQFGVGALWLYALDAPIRADIRVSRTEIVDSTITALQFIGKPIRSVRLARTTVDGAAGWLQLQGGGDALVSDLRARNIEVPGYLRCTARFRLRLQRVAADLAAPSTRLCGRLDAATVERRLGQ